MIANYFTYRAVDMRIAQQYATFKHRNDTQENDHGIIWETLFPSSVLSYKIVYF